MRGQHDARFYYMMLGRLVSDCEYYLNWGGRSPRVLWAGSEKEQISEMRRIYRLLPIKPEWLTLDDIANYENQMGISRLVFSRRKRELNKGGYNV